MELIKKLSILILLMGTMSIQAQDIAVVDIADVLNNMEDYRNAEQELDNIAAAWQQEIAEEYDKIKGMYNKYQAESPLLTNEMKTAKEEEIVAKEEEVRNMQREKFGPEGQLFKKRQELVAPIQEKVFNELDSFAADRGYGLILDKNGNAGILFASDKYDKTADFKRRLGIK